MTDDLNTLPLDRLFDRLVDRDALDRLIAAARDEDLGAGGDVTSRLMTPPDLRAVGEIRCRAEGVLAGAVLLRKIAAAYDPALEVSAAAVDGDHLQTGRLIASVAGPLRALLSAERVLLNFLAHLSGIATLTARYVSAVSGTAARIYDTRKTVPGLRALARYAVRCGGGCCHRIGLYDAVLVKDNHLAPIRAADVEPALSSAIERARRDRSPPAFIEIEVDTLEQLQMVLRLDVDIILLDNMGPDQLATAVAMRDRLNRRVRLEASGGVDLQTVRAVAEAGVDRIAIGALTHSAPALDIGLDVEARPGG